MQTITLSQKQIWKLSYMLQHERRLEARSDRRTDVLDSLIELVAEAEAAEVELSKAKSLVRSWSGDYTHTTQDDQEDS